MDPDNSTAFLKCYLGGSDEYQKCSLGADGMFIGENGWAFRENRETKMFRQSVTFNNNHVDYIVTNVANNWISTMTQDRAVFAVNVNAPNIDSSGSYSHCHVCEPVDQSLDWASLTGRLMESSGHCAVRDDSGALITDFKQVPGLSYAMTSVRIADKSALGVLLSVEEVSDNEIDHAHGITLRHKVSEDDGHKILRVCGAGDCMVWTVQPVSADIKLTPRMLSGLYTRYENGIEQTEKVIMTCNEDFSFHWMVSGTSLEALAIRVLALEAQVQTLTNQH